MASQVEKIKGFRLFLLKQVADLTIEQVNFVPQGYNNNIVWNIGHMIAASITLCYVRSGLPLPIDDKYISAYQTGTKPSNPVSEVQYHEIKKLFISTVDQLESDYERKIFRNYSPSVAIPKVYGFEVNTIDDALAYLLYHEGLHTTVVVSIKNYCVAKKGV